MCGDCVYEHVGNTCSHRETQECVCLSDPYCCQSQNVLWDEFCTDHAINTCFCGSPVIGINSPEDSIGDSPEEGTESPVSSTDSPVETESPVEEEVKEPTPTQSSEESSAGGL